MSLLCIDRCIIGLFKLQKPRDAVLLHGHAVEDVRLLHRAAAMGDEDELGVIGEVAQIPRILADIGLIERRVDLIERSAKLPDS